MSRLSLVFHVVPHGKLIEVASFHISTVVSHGLEDLLDLYDLLANSSLKELLGHFLERKIFI